MSNNPDQIPFSAIFSVLGVIAFIVAFIVPVVLCLQFCIIGGTLIIAGRIQALLEHHRDK